MSGQLSPWLVEAGELGDERCVELGDPCSQWPHPRARQFAACGGDRCAGAQVVEYVAQCGGALHEVVDRAEHGGVGGGRDGRGGDGAGDEAHVVPAVLGDAVGGDLEHLFGGVDPDDGPGGADLVLQQRQA